MVSRKNWKKTKTKNYILNISFFFNRKRNKWIWDKSTFKKQTVIVFDLRYLDEEMDEEKDGDRDEDQPKFTIFF